MFGIYNRKQSGNKMAVNVLNVAPQIVIGFEEKRKNTMNNIEDILKEVEKNHINLEAGVSFYYADRNKKKPVKCKILSVEFRYPAAITAQREDTEDIFICYDGFGCYPLDNYDAAYEDSQIQEDRIIY